MVGSEVDLRVSAPQSLLTLCLFKIASLFDGHKENPYKNWKDSKVSLPIDAVGGAVAESLQLYLLSEGIGLRSFAAWRDSWRPSWLLSLGCGIRAAVVTWDATVLRFVTRHCPRVRKLLVLNCGHFSNEPLAYVPATVATIDLEGQLFFRGKLSPVLTYFKKGDFKVAPWVTEAAELYSALSASMVRPLKPETSHPALVELDLGASTASAEQLSMLIRRIPQLRWLRHYQMTAALFHLHGADWRSQKSLPSYILCNIDADFSHLVRWQNGGEAEPILPSDALNLATQLCPSASDIRVRFSGATSHDTLAPLAKLRKIRSLSAVCVTSGQRARLDFTDVCNLLESKGRELRRLELKVLEEVDIHSLILHCPRLERLVLSGCGNRYSPACTNAACNLPTLNHLRLLFFADGDDFSWDHVVPQCFWKAVFGGKGEEGRSLLRGIFLESPRMTESTIREVILRPAGDVRSPLFPHLQVLSVCRASEMTPEVVGAMIGVPGVGARARGVPQKLPPAAPGLRYIRLSRCEQFGVASREMLVNLLREQRQRSNAPRVFCVVD